MRARALIRPVVVFLLLMAGFNVLIARTTTHALPLQLIARIDASPPVTDLFIGNSLIEQGIAPRLFEAARPGTTAFNAAFMATFPVEHVILLERAERLRPVRVYYGFSDAQLTTTAADDWKWLSGSASVFDYVDARTATRYRTDLGTWLTLRAGALLPMVSARFSLWGRIERGRRALGAIGMPPEETNALGRVRDFAALEPDSPDSFRQRLRVITSSGLGLSAPVADLLAVARNAGQVIVVIQMPMRLEHRLRYNTGPEWEAYRGQVRRLVEAAGARYLDASDWAPDEDFIDAIHLSVAGAARFTGRLAQASRES